MSLAIVSGTCSIAVSDSTPAGLKAKDKSVQVKWDHIHSVTADAISLCATTDANVITGTVVIVGRTWFNPTNSDELGEECRLKSEQDISR